MIFEYFRVDIPTNFQTQLHHFLLGCVLKEKAGSAILKHSNISSYTINQLTYKTEVSAARVTTTPEAPAFGDGPLFGRIVS